MSTDLKSEAAMPDPADKTVYTEPTSPATGTVYTEPVDPTVEEVSGNQQFQKVLNKASELLADLPDYVTDFFKEYKRPLVTIGLVLTAFISVKLLLAMLSAINEVPLLAPTFELIGLSYSGWFIYRFVLKDVNRQELGENITALKDQVLGKR